MGVQPPRVQPPSIHVKKNLVQRPFGARGVNKTKTFVATADQARGDLSRLCSLISGTPPGSSPHIMASDDVLSTVGDLLDDPEGYYPPTPPAKTQTYTLRSGKPIALRLVGHSATEAHHLWNGAKAVTAYFEDEPARVRGKTVLELGAAAGLPSLAAAVLGARRVVMTDFPDSELLENMQRNIDGCDETIEPRGLIRRIVDAAGFVWGGDPGPLLARLRGGSPDDAASAAASADDDDDGKGPFGFDVLVLADLLFRHNEHGALVKTIRETLRRSPDSAAYVFFTSYRPWKQKLDMAFFDVARREGLQVEQVAVTKLDRPLFDGDPGDLEVQKTVKGFTVRWPADGNEDGAGGPRAEGSAAGEP